MPRRRRAEEHGEPLFADDENAWHDDGFTFEEHQPRGRGLRVIGCLLPLVLVAAIGFGGWQAYQYLSNYFGNESCLLRSGESEEKLTPEQAANAATIVTVGTTLRDLPRYAANIAVTTAIQESKLRNLTYGDRDSVGLFQQRPSQGWGTLEQVADPVYASGEFYRHLVQVDDWQTRPLTQVAQEVQRSGFPDAYADHETEGRVMTDALSGAAPGAVGCRLDPPTESSTAAQVVTKLREQTGVRAQADGATVSADAGDVTTARTLGTWAVAHAQAEGITRVTVGDREWVRQRGRAGWSWQPARDPVGATDVRIRLG